MCSEESASNGGNVSMSERDERPTVLIVDDVPANIAVANTVLKGTVRTRIASSGEKALVIASSDPPPDLVLLDVMMPEMDGYVVCQKLKSDPRTADIPVIFLTARSEARDEQKGFDLGAVDYITKPISPPILMARVRTHLALKEAHATLRRENQRLEKRVEERTRELSMLQDVTILAMASLAETRDNETGNHIRRTQNYVRELAQALQDHPRFSAYLTHERIGLLYKTAPLHDIGKVGIPDAILLKPGRLTDEEFAVMKRHAEYGRDAILAAERRLDAPQPFLQMAREIAYSHHEKWDGSGYPQGLAGEAIPLAARLMAVADVYDALISRRVYKPPFSHEKAMAVIAEGRGSHFDPDIVEAFLNSAQGMQAIAEHFADSEELIPLAMTTSRC